LTSVCYVDSDYLFKLLLIGDSGVGKSCLLLRFAVCLSAVSQDSHSAMCAECGLYAEYFLLYPHPLSTQDCFSVPESVPPYRLVHPSFQCLYAQHKRHPCLDVNCRIYETIVC